MDITQLDMRWLLTLASSPLTLGFIVYGAVATLKSDYERNAAARPLSPWAWRCLAAIIGLVLGLILHLVTGVATVGYPGWVGAILFSLFAAAIAVLGHDGLRSVLRIIAAGMAGGAAVSVGDAGTVNVNVPPDPAPVPVPKPAPVAPAPVIPPVLPVEVIPVAAPAPDPAPAPVPTPTPELVSVPPSPTPLMLYPANTPGMDNVLHRGLILGSLPTPSSTITITPEVSA